AQHPRAAALVGVRARRPAVPQMRNGDRAAHAESSQHILVSEMSVVGLTLRAAAISTLIVAPLATILAALSWRSRSNARTVIIAGNIPGRTQTLALAIYDRINSGHDNEAMIFVIDVVVIALTAIIASELLVRRQRRRASR